MQVLPRSFYLRDALEVARDLLGCELVHDSPEGLTAGFIVETEAYRGVDDAASHAYRGARTGRTAVMYLSGGRAYVYLIYGMYYCLNITAGPEEVPHCVLIRALEPSQGLELMQMRNGTKPVKATALANGPGKLCRAMGIDGSLYGVDMCDDRLFVREGRRAEAVSVSPRVGVDYAGAAKAFPWRFYLEGSQYVSKRPNR